MQTKLKIAHCFNKAATHYDKAASLQLDISHFLQQKLQQILIKPEVVLDIGCGTGNFAAGIQRIYPNASIIALDIANEMLHAMQTLPENKLPQRICADFDQLPLTDGCINLLFSNMALQWSDALPRSFTELKRVLAERSWMVFSLVADNSLCELKNSYRAVGFKVQVNDFYTLANVSEALLKNNFRIIELGVLKKVLFFNDIFDVLNNLKLIGANHVLQRKQTGLRGRNYFKKLAAAYQQFATEQGVLPMSYEIIYGIAQV